MLLPFHRIAILGLGLIGGSLARALKAKRPQTHIAAFDLSHDALTYAAQQGYIDSAHAHAGQAAKDADIIVLAAPPSTFATLAADAAAFLKADAVVTDTASVKRHAVGTITPHLPEQNHFVPGHPIAGAEKSGIKASSTDLFAGKRTVLTPQESDVMGEPVARVRALWEAAGAQVEYMPADTHDRIYATVSHMPHLVAFAARHSMRDLPQPRDEASQRFVRLMHASPALWADICLANADYVGAALADFIAFAGQMRGELDSPPAAGGVAAEHVAELFPRVVATCLIATASLLQESTGIHPARYAGSGFADMTAPALGDPHAALEAISSHHWVIAERLGKLLKRLHRIRESLNKKDKTELSLIIK